MPTYEYVCRSCGRQLEVVQKFSDPPLETCDVCEGSLRKVYSAAGIIFKGSGYYVTDTRSSNGKSGASRPASSDSGSSSSSSASSSGSSDSGSSGSDSSGSGSSGSDSSSSSDSGSSASDAKSA